MTLYTQSMNQAIISKPMLRGHFHQAMFFVALGALIPLILRCNSAREYVAMTVYAVTSLILFGVSSLYHRINWDHKKRMMMRRLDHSGIFLSLAGGFTPVCLLVLSPSSGHTLLIIIWCVAILGVMKSMIFVNLPKFVNASVYLISGMILVPYLPEMRASVGELNFWLVLLGGAIYGFGAMCYAFKRPNLFPKVFGYHEMFHLCVNVAAAIHFYVISSFIH